MKKLAEIVCISFAFLVPVARTGADDNEQSPSLFDQVRDGIAKLKPGMKFEEAKHLLTISKLKFTYLTASYSTAYYHYEIRDKSSLTLMVYVRWEKNSRDPVVIDTELRNGEKVVASFDAHKK